MSDFLLHTTQPQTETPISNIFLDEYMPAANGAYVKIYLYLLRCMKSGQDMLSIPAIADRFEHTENDVHRALVYWEKMQLLRLEYDSQRKLSGICLLEPKHVKTASPQEKTEDFELSQGSTPASSVPASSSQESGILSSAAQEETPLSQDAPAPARTEYTADQLACFQEQKEIHQLLFICEQYLGKTLSPTEIATILYFYDGLGFSPDLIEYLIEYCVSKNHKSLRYIESVALAWHQEGYQTVTQAKKGSSVYGKSYFAILKAFGIKGRNPVEAEISYMNKWLQEWGFSLDLITEACNRTMGAIHQPSFAYTDSILKSWYTSKVKSLADVKALDSQRTKKAQPSPAPASPPRKSGAPNRFHNFKQRDYDFSKLEEKLINH